jgi:alpha-beta hydrolase superfamily lysophospholipase
MTEFQLQGHAGALHATAWEHRDPRHLLVIAHGYGEHIGRYEHVAAALGAPGAAVYGLDHAGHGRSEGERALISDMGAVVEDLHLLVRHAQAAHPDRPLVLVGHSMGGLVATLYAERHGSELAGLVLSAPLIGSHPATVLLALEPLPEIPIDVTTLSRDEAVQRAYAEDPLVYHGGFKRPTLAAIGAGLLDAALDARAVTGPVLWQHGEADQLVPLSGSRRLIERFTEAEVSVRHYPQARHEIFNELNRDEILADTNAFIASIAGAR